MPDAQTPAQVSLFDQPPAASVKIVGGFQFTHGRADDGKEFFSHYDPRTGREFWIERTTAPEAHAEVRRTWFAFAGEGPPGKPRPAEVLNTALTRGEQVLRCGALYHLDAHDADALLRGLARLIASGEWPAEARWERLTILTNGSADQWREPDPLDALFERLRTETLDPEFVERNGPPFARLPNHSFRARGRFLGVGADFDVRGPLAEMRPLGRALKAAQKTANYRRALERYRERKTRHRGAGGHDMTDPDPDDKLPEGHARCKDCRRVLPLSQYAAGTNYIVITFEYNEEGDIGLCNTCYTERESTDRVL